MPGSILFIHQNFPGQFRHLAPRLQALGHRCEAIAAPQAPGLADISLHRYGLPKPPPAEAIHPWARDFHTKCLRADAVARQAVALQQQGFSPDLVIGHPGWGELMAIKDVFPAVPVWHQLEFVYQLEGGDYGFDPEFEDQQWQRQARLRLRRAPQLQAFHELDCAVAPTQWQASTAPAEFRDRVQVIHEGIDTTAIKPNPEATVTLQRGNHCFQLGDELVTFVARNLEPYRGFHTFMRTLPLLQRLRPHCHVIVVGGEEVSYGAPPKGGGSWKQQLLKEVGDQLDSSRVHFVGRVPHGVLHNLFQVSACHVYLTYPFVLSWSMLEAMSCGALVLGSATPPVEEVITPGVNGLLCDFFDAEALAAQLAEVLENRGSYQHLRDQARVTAVERYDLEQVCLPQQLALAESMMNVG